jgi:hypothetical protein
MIHTSVIHIDTSFLPVYFCGVAFICHNAGRLLGKTVIKKVGYNMFMATTLVTTLTCGFGGASIRAAEAIKGIDQLNVKFHAWTAMTVFLLTTILAVYSFRALLGRGEEIKNDKMLFAVSLVFFLVFFCTLFLAYRIR